MMATPDPLSPRQTLPLMAGFWRWWVAFRFGLVGWGGWRWRVLLCSLLLSGLAGAAPAAAPAEIRLDEATPSPLTLAKASLAPGLATKWEIDPKDSKRWIFTLRKDVKLAYPRGETAEQPRHQSIASGPTTSACRNW